MCGIFGCVLNEGDAAPLVREGLKRLEYRGYDSVGVATVWDGKVFVKKDVGKLDEVHAKLNLDDLPGCVGIGHTRWATHGAPEQVNAHPHTDCTGEVAVVHNGIVENFVELKRMLEQKRHVFRSRCDTEVIAHLIEDELKKAGSLVEAVRRALREVKGSYAIAVVHAKHPDRIVCARLESPLVIGLSSRGMYCSSDIPSFLHLTRRAVFLQDYQVAEISLNGVRVYDLITGKEIPYEVQQLDLSEEAAEKSGYPHFMLKEIFEQPQAMKNALRTHELYYDLMAPALANAKRVFLTACGTSYHACVAASYALSELGGITAQPVIASEFINYVGPAVDEETVVLAVSQSGETADTLSAVRFARSKGATVLGVTNVMGSSLTRLSTVYIGQNSGPEIGVAATKTFTAQLTVLLRLAMKVGLRTGTLSQESYEGLSERLLAMPDYAAKVLETVDERVKLLASKYADRQSFCFLGRGISSATAMEGRLKLLEIAYIPCLAYPAGESKHGFIAVVEKGYPTVFVAPNDSTRTKIIGNIMEMKAREASVISLIEEGDREIAEFSDDYLEMPKGIPEMFTPLIYVIPLQLLAYYISVYRGYDPDKPRNLAKSVTVQ